MTKLSKVSLSIHRKWQEEAIKRGGCDAKIIISQSQAAPIVMDLLRESFRPMNITYIYEALKAKVPPPVLKACLATFSREVQEDDERDNSSHDEDADDGVFVSKKFKKKKKQSKKVVLALSEKQISSSHSVRIERTGAVHRYEKSVRVKMGRNANITLYHYNQAKFQNDGNGFSTEDRSNLLCKKQQATEKLREIVHGIKLAKDETAKLLSEPINEKIHALLLERERALNHTKVDLIAAKRFAGNAACRETLKRKIHHSASHWRTRKRKCIDFLEIMEDCTDGAVSKKLCLVGKGQIDIDSDESAVQQAKEHYHRVQSGKLRSRCSVLSSEAIGASNPKEEASKSFIGVILGPKATITNVYAD